MEPALIGYRIDDIVIDLRNRQLWRRNQLIPLNSKYFDVLLLLISRPNQLTTRQQLFEQIWKEVIVTDWALSQCIKDIRRALGDEAANPRYIKTLPKHGFMFIGELLPIKEGEVLFEERMAAALFSRRPYKFLDYYREEDSEYFFGRKSEVELICSKILSHRCFLLYGRSGVGKSSIVHAGLLPALKKRGFHTCSLRSYQNPLDDLQTALQPEWVKENKGELEKNQLVDPVQHPGGMICLFDQFEEFFLLTDEEIREKFLTGLDGILKINRIPLRLVFVIREDFLAAINFFKEIFPEIFHHEYRLQRLESKQALKAVINPAKKVGFVYESKLVEQIITDLSDHGFIDPPQLQIVCDTLYDQRDSTARISLNSYQELGGAAGILSQYLKRVVNRFGIQEIELVKSLLISLISNDGRRLLLPVSKLESQLAARFSLPVTRIRQTMEDLSQARLLRFMKQDGENRVELTHDFLIPEVSSWLSEEDLAVKRAENLLNRALENYKAHQLLLDPDTLEHILPLGENLKMTAEHSELLLKSLLNRGKSIPTWLISLVPAVASIILDAAGNKQPEIRLAAVQSAVLIQDDRLKNVLRIMALWDTDWPVRRLASIVLIEKYGNEGLKYLQNKDQEPPPGLVRRAVSIAFVRDQLPEMIQLRKVPLLILMLVLGGLAWIRLHRQKTRIWQQTTRGTAGAALAGLVVGGILGCLLIYFRQTPLYESITMLLALTSLGTIAGMLAGLGISLGMSSIQAIGYRHSPYWSIIGATLGGMLIGGLVHLIGVDTFLALFGQRLPKVAGAYEGGLIGLGLSVGRHFGLHRITGNRWLTHLLAALGAMLAAILLTLIQSNLFSASIETIAHSFSQSQIKLETLSILFGEAHFGQVSRLILGAVEGFLFGGFLSMGYDRRNYSGGND
jgi:DNA-binding winged helix-turn-helix (wHTH) protein